VQMCNAHNSPDLRVYTTVTDWTALGWWTGCEVYSPRESLKRVFSVLCVPVDSERDRRQRQRSDVSSVAVHSARHRGNHWTRNRHHSR